MVLEIYFTWFQISGNIIVYLNCGVKFVLDLQTQIHPSNPHILQCFTGACIHVLIKNFDTDQSIWAVLPKKATS